MKHVTFAFAASLLLISAGPALARSNDAATTSQSDVTATSSSTTSTHEYVVARGGADNGAGHDEFDDHGGR